MIPSLSDYQKCMLFAASTTSVEIVPQCFRAQNSCSRIDVRFSYKYVLMCVSSYEDIMTCTTHAKYVMLSSNVTDYVKQKYLQSIYNMFVFPL